MHKPTSDKLLSSLDLETSKTESYRNIDSVKEIVVKELQEKSDGSIWLWSLFILCVTPNILGSVHILSYVFLSKMPDNFYCMVGDLKNAGWTLDEIQNVSKLGIELDNKCDIRNWNYTAIATQSYENFMLNLHEYPLPAIIKCKADASNYFEYESSKSIVSEWDLVCEKTVLRSNVQGMFSLGRLMTAPILGVLADKFGRQTIFTWSVFTMLGGSLLEAFTPLYSVLLVARFFIGVACQGFIHPLQTLVAENATNKYRTFLGVAINTSYPIGIMLLTVFAYFLNNWRQLALAIALPTFLLLVHIHFLCESPRWLITKGRIIEAYEAVFNKTMPLNLLKVLQKETEYLRSEKESIMQQIRNVGNEFTFLYRSKYRKMILISHYIWFATLLCCNVTAINNNNLSTNVYVYVTAISFVDLIADGLAIVITRYTGKKTTGCVLFSSATIFFFAILVVPKKYTMYFIVLSRLFISAQYSVVSLHTIEMFPTNNRNTALGLNSFFGNLGMLVAPYVVDLLGEFEWWIPTTICGTLTFFGIFLTVLLPETNNEKLEDHHNSEKRN